MIDALAMNCRTLLQLLQCLSNDAEQRSVIRASSKRPDRLVEHRYFVPNITLASFKNCSLIAENVHRLVAFEAPVKKIGDKDVAFQMIHDDLNDTRMQVVITTSYNNSWIV